MQAEAEAGRSTPSAATQTSVSSAPCRYELLTVWRGVACLMVMICHAIFTGYARPLPEESNWVYTILGKGWLGVPLFFVISGYCITASVCALQSQGISTWQFFRRRFQRIYPP